MTARDDAVTLWRYSNGDEWCYVEGGHLDTDDEYRALPAPAFDALVASRATALARVERLEGAMRDMLNAAERVPVDREWSPLLRSSMKCARSALAGDAP